MTRRDFIDRFRDLDPCIGRALERLGDAELADLIARTVTGEPTEPGVRRIEHWATDPATGLKFALALMTDGTYRTFEGLSAAGFRALCDEELGYELANGF